MKFSSKIERKSWDPNIETELFDIWQNDGTYKFNKNSSKPLFSIDTPPPYVNTPVHIGHAYVYVWMDMIARSKRMAGYNVLFPMGLDQNGLPIEVQAEKEFNMNIRKVSRETFIEKCQELLKRYGDISLDSFKRLGLSCNSWSKGNEIGARYETDDPEYRKLTQETFINMWKKGLIYDGIGTTNYCPNCKTAISNAEVEYRESYTDLTYVTFGVKETGKSILVATTRPELLSTVKLVIYNPEDERYRDLKGRHAVVPLFNQTVSIIPHPYARPEFGTGLVMVSSFGDYADIRLLRELNIEPTYAIDSNGRMNEHAGKYAGLKVTEARAKILEDLYSFHLILKKEKILHREPICERSKDAIEFIAMNEIYLKQLDYTPRILQIADEMQFHAPESKQILLDWVDSLTMDWVISRRRYYGTEIPLWRCRTCGNAVVPDPGKYYQPWKDDCPIKKCHKCGGDEFVGEDRIFDTWFDSCTSEVYILGSLWDKDFFKKNFPCSIRPQGKEIVRNWLYFTMLKSLHLFDEKPFENVWVHMHVVDEKGEKMSKRQGNVINPKNVLQRYGAEAFRIWSCLEGDISKGDIRCSFDRIDGQSKFLTKFWNISRFISMFPVTNGEPGPTDRWILAELSTLVNQVLKKYAQYAFSDAATIIRDFTWNIFASHYIEIVKARAYGDGLDKTEQKSAWYTLHTCLKTMLLLLAPILPFFTDHLWRQLYGTESIHLERFPEPIWDNKFVKISPILMEFNSHIWNAKKNEGISLKGEISVLIPDPLRELAPDLKKMHNIK